MIDKRTMEKLRLIGKDVPRELKNKAIKIENAHAQDKTKVEALLRNNKTSKDVKDMIYKTLQAGMYDKPREIVQERYAKQIEDIVDAKVRQAITRGDLPDPKEVVKHDSLIQTRN